MIVGFVLCATDLVLAPMALADMPGPNAKELWNYIMKVSPYQKRSFWPDHQGMQPGHAPHGPAPLNENLGSNFSKKGLRTK